MIKLTDLQENGRKGLWANIHAKRKRGEKPARKGSKAYKHAVKMGKKIKAAEKNEEFVRESEMQCFMEYLKDMHEATNEGPILEAEYQGRKVKLNKPMAGDVAKFKVYVKDGDSVKKVNFGQKGARIKKDNPEARRSFRARHKCDQKKDKTTAGYWSCKKW
jgi:biotin carboxyl carrier protein|tara:strand:+ start:1703 stop:2185 length:483 start_codon:yes stop_codon:yes gene_type:complete